MYTQTPSSPAYTFSPKHPHSSAQTTQRSSQQHNANPPKHNAILPRFGALCLFFCVFFFGCIDKQSVEGQMQLLESTYYVRRIEAARALGKMGFAARKAIPAMRRRFVIDNNPNVRLEIVQSFGKIRDISAIPELLQAIGDEAEEIRIKASYALGEIGAPAIAPLQALLAKPQPLEKVYHAVAALGHIGPSALPALRAMLRSASDKIRQKTVEALKQIGPPAGELLLLAMNDEVSGIRAYTAWCLMQLGPQILRQQPALQTPLLSALQKSLHDDSDKARMYALLALRSLGNLASTAAPRLRQLLQDRLWYIRKIAATTLAGLGESARIAIPELVTSLQDDTWDVRQEAAAALLTLRPLSILPQLGRLLNDHRPHVRRTALQLFLQIQPSLSTEQIKRILSMLQDPSVMVREALRDRIVRLPKPPLALLLQTTQGKSSRAAVEALVILAELAAKAQDTHETLKNLRTRPHTTAFHKALGIALQATQPTHTTPPPTQCNGDDTTTRNHCLFQLGLLRSPSSQAFQSLRLALRDNEHTIRHQAILSLGWQAARLDDDSIHAIYSLIRRETEPRIRLSAIDALGWAKTKATSHVPFLLQRLPSAPSPEQKRILQALREIGLNPQSFQTLLTLTEKAKPTLLFLLLPALPSFATTLFPQKAPKQPALDRLRAILERALIHSLPAVRQTAAIAYSELGEHGIPSIPALQRLLSDNSVAVRAAAVHALGWLGHKAAPAAPKIGWLLQNKEPFLQRNAVFALRRIGSKAVSELLKALPSASPPLRNNIVFALSRGTIEPNEMHPTLVALRQLRTTLPPNDPLHARIASAILRIESHDKPYVLWVDHPRSPTFDAFTPQLLLPHKEDPFLRVPS